MAKESIEFDANELEELLRKAKEKAKTDWEKSFVEDMSNKFEQWGDRLYLSQKQMDIIRKIAKQKSISGNRKVA